MNMIILNVDKLFSLSFIRNEAVSANGNCDNIAETDTFIYEYKCLPNAQVRLLMPVKVFHQNVNIMTQMTLPKRNTQFWTPTRAGNRQWIENVNLNLEGWLF